MANDKWEILLSVDLTKAPVGIGLRGMCVLHVEVADVERVIFDELAARLHRIAHEN